MLRLTSKSYIANREDYTSDKNDNFITFNEISDNGKDFSLSIIDSIIKKLQYSIKNYERFASLVDIENPISPELTTEYITPIEGGKKIFKSSFVALIFDSIFEYGYTNQADKFLLNQFNLIGPYAGSWLGELYIEYINNEEFIVRLLMTLSHLPYEVVGSEGVLIAANALNHKSDIVKENGIRAFENWENQEYIELLKNMELHTEWIKDYRDSVVKGLSIEYADIH